MSSVDEPFGVYRALDEEVSLCRCECYALLKVMSLPIGSKIVCPSCGREFVKPSSGRNTENFAGVLTVMLIRAKVFATQANAPPNSVCDHCHTPTPKVDGYAATRELMLLGSLEDLLRYKPGFPPDLTTEAIDGAVRMTRRIIEADPTPWLLCEGCASIIFPSALAKILSVKENAELWDLRQLPSSVADFLTDYSSGLPGEIGGKKE